MTDDLGIPGMEGDASTGAVPGEGTANSYPDIESAMASVFRQGSPDPGGEENQQTGEQDDAGAAEPEESQTTPTSSPPDGEGDQAEAEVVPDAAPAEGAAQKSIEIDGKTLTEQEIKDAILRDQNRATFEQAAEQHAKQLNERVQWIQNQVQVLQKREQEIQKANQENIAYGEYLAWKESGGSGDIAEFVQTHPHLATETGSAPGKPDLSPQGLEQMFNQWYATRRQQEERALRERSIQQNTPAWVEAVVKEEPVFKGRERAYEVLIVHRLLTDLQTKGPRGPNGQPTPIDPASLSETQIRGLLKQYAREEAEFERKLRSNDVGDALADAARTGKRLPALAKTSGTPMPARPNGLKTRSVEELINKSNGDFESAFDLLAADIRNQASEIQKLTAKRLGRS